MSKDNAHFMLDYKYINKNTFHKILIGMIVTKIFIHLNEMNLNNITCLKKLR